MKLFKNFRNKLKTKSLQRTSKEDFDKMQKYEMSIWAFRGGDNNFGGFETENSMKTCNEIANQKEKEYKKFLKSLRIKYGIESKTPVPNIRTHELWTDGTIRKIMKLRGKTVA